MTAALLPRGLRLNNPGNVRRTTDPFLGLSPEQPDPEFFSFVDPVYGVRAMARILRNYNARYGLDTVRKIVNRYAPPSENKTNEYVDHVAAKMRIGPDTPFDVRGRLPELVSVMILHEQGRQPYPPELILRAITMA